MLICFQQRSRQRYLNIIREKLQCKFSWQCKLNNFCVPRKSFYGKFQIICGFFHPANPALECMPLSLFAPLSWLQIYQIDTSDLATSVERGCTSAYQACAMQSIVHSACSWKTQWRKAQQMQPVWKGVATCAAACQPCALQLKRHSGEKLNKCNQCGKRLPTTCSSVTIALFKVLTALCVKCPRW